LAIFITAPIFVFAIISSVIMRSAFLTGSLGIKQPQKLLFWLHSGSSRKKKDSPPKPQQKGRASMHKPSLRENLARTRN